MVQDFSASQVHELSEVCQLSAECGAGPCQSRHEPGLLRAWGLGSDIQNSDDPGGSPKLREASSAMAKGSTESHQTLLGL